ncbi:MAG: NAD(P)H-dependent glycerol-3-phosphate dehydrogenase [Burkholderiaceae bacterium]
MHIAILGAGAWGTALAKTAAAHHEVTLYARDAKQVQDLLAHRENRLYLPGVHLPESVRVVGDLGMAVAPADLVLVATPVAGLRSVCDALGGTGCRALVWLCKGIEEESGLLPHAVVRSILPEARGAVLSGPSFALEVAQGLPTALTVASQDAALQDVVVEALHRDSLRVYKSSDVVGVELGGAVKNVLAIATGIGDGMDLGLNARAALITRGLSEMMRLGEAIGARPETLMGLTGVGDLILTCTGALSRNRQVGLALGRGQSLAEVLAGLGHAVEGVRCARNVRAMAREGGVEMPITEAVCRVLFEGVPPQEAVALLLARQPRAEQ